jgi:hypothetical protein
LTTRFLPRVTPARTQEHRHPERSEGSEADSRPQPGESRQCDVTLFLSAISNYIRPKADLNQDRIPRHCWENDLRIFVGNRNQGWCHPINAHDLFRSLYRNSLCPPVAHFSAANAFVLVEG